LICNLCKYILNERALAEYPKHSLQIAALQQLFIALASSPAAFAAVSIGAGSFHVPDLTISNWKVALALLYIGILSTGAAAYLQMIALVHMSASHFTVRRQRVYHYFQFARMTCCSPRRLWSIHFSVAISIVDFDSGASIRGWISSRFPRLALEFDNDSWFSIDLCGAHGKSFIQSAP
jgi:hypothetical protein